MFGADGDDSLRGNGGDDILYGGPDNDYLNGGKGADTLYGEDGKDRLDGGGGNDKLYGGDKDDKLYGGPDDDELYGGPGEDRLDGGTGKDRLVDTEGAKQYFYDMDGGDVWISGPGEDRFVMKGPTEKGPNIIDDLTMNDAIQFKNKCGWTTKWAAKHVAKVLEPENTSNTLGGPWEVWTNTEMTKAYIRKQAEPSKQLEWNLKTCD